MLECCVWVCECVVYDYVWAHYMYTLVYMCLCVSDRPPHLHVEVEGDGGGEEADAGKEAGADEGAVVVG